jgi:hypothetical protein
MLGQTLKRFVRNYCKMGDLSNFQRGQTVGARLAGSICNKMASLLGVSRAAVPKAVTAHTNHGKKPLEWFRWSEG